MGPWAQDCSIGHPANINCSCLLWWWWQWLCFQLFVYFFVIEHCIWCPKNGSLGARLLNWSSHKHQLISVMIMLVMMMAMIMFSTKGYSICIFFADWTLYLSSEKGSPWPFGRGGEKGGFKNIWAMPITTVLSLFVILCIFIGPRYAWDPIYGSACPSLTHSQTLLRLYWCDSGWLRYQLNTCW